MPKVEQALTTEGNRASGRFSRQAQIANCSWKARMVNAGECRGRKPPLIPIRKQKKKRK